MVKPLKCKGACELHMNDENDPRGVIENNQTSQFLKDLEHVGSLFVVR